MLRHAALALLTMFTSQWHPNHARNTEVLVIELPETYQLVDCCLLLRQSANLWDKAGLIYHGSEVEIGAEGGGYYVCNVREHVG